MSSWRSDVQSIRIDGATGTLVNISRWVNSFNLGASFPTLDDTGLSDTQGKTLPGLADAPTGSINGRLCSTTEAIFGPLINGTSVSKTLEVKLNTGRYMIGEVSLTDVSLEGSAKALATYSASIVAEAGFTRTSIAAS